MEQPSTRFLTVTLLAWFLVLGGRVRGDDDRKGGQPPGGPVRAGFLVSDAEGCALLGADGTELERLPSLILGSGAISPDGRWVINSGPGHELLVQSRVDPQEQATLPMLWRGRGFATFRPIWSPDSKRLLIGENLHVGDGVLSLRLHDLAAKKVTRLVLSGGEIPSDWSADGKRVLTTINAGQGTDRIAWLNVDGSGDPEFLTGEHECADGGRLSPDQRRMLCTIVPKADHEAGRRGRLHVLDLVTGTRTMVDKPGSITSFCWSSDGKRIAYAWHPPLPDPRNAPEQRMFLVTCDPDGSDRKTITVRTLKLSEELKQLNQIMPFFFVQAWWR